MCFSLPPATKRSVQLDQRQQFVPFGLSESQFRVEQIPVGIQGVQQRIDSTPIPPIGQTRPVLEGGDQQLLFLPNLPDLPVLDERIRHFPESGLNRSFVSDERSLLLSFSQSFIR